MAKKSYDHNSIDPKWQARWREDGTYAAKEDSGKEKKYVLDMFPYPSGEGLHVGHPKGYIATDVYSRYQRMHGKEVLHPMGWDAFGLPAENYALKNKVHPRVAVKKNIAYFKQQLEKIGFDYDWSREVNTTDPEFYKWTQWIFLKLYEKGLAFRSEEPINWCPSCMTGLANEDVEQGICERCGTAVVKKTLPQWVLKITDYADRMLEDLVLLPKWPEHIKESQRNWIGRSEGYEIDFKVSGETVTVFTTRPDTLYGATYLVLAPEHPYVQKLLSMIANRKEIHAYIEAAAAKTEIERTAEGKEKTGVCLEGVTAINPSTNEEIPVWIADYVLAHYGTGAVMGVPAHDERDFVFAKKYGLVIKPVVAVPITNPHNPPIEGKTNTDRNVIHAILHNPKDDTYLVGFLKDESWGDRKPVNFVIGGVEEGEDWAEAAAREIREETGYTDFTLDKELPIHVNARFFQAQKDVNRNSYVRTFLFEFVSDKRLPIDAEEEAKHEFKWLPAAEVGNHLNIPTDQLVWKYIQTGGFATGEPGMLVNSGPFSGKDSEEMKEEMALAAGGRKSVNYRLRDWVFSRQRYWGEPIPILYCEKDGVVPVPYEDLPVRLPEVEHYEPTGTGESPLAAITDWVNTICPKCGGPAKRETNTMPQWAGSSWYYLRFMDPHNSKELVSKNNEQYWAPVDLYVGGAEHATRHLIYARFWHKFLFDIGAVTTLEPFNELHSVGLIIAEDGRKMSKRFGNVVNPDDVVAEYGADAFRVYEMFMGPFENSIAWNTKNLVGSRRFLDRIFAIAGKVVPEDVPQLNASLHAAIKKVSEDIPAFRFNTAVSAMMICLNAIDEAGGIGNDQWKSFLRLLAPFAPHLAEELWEQAGETNSIHLAPWPEFDPKFLVQDTVIIGVQVAGKTRGEIEIAINATEKEAVKAALAIPKIAAALPTGKPSKIIYRAGRILNLLP